MKHPDMKHLAAMQLAKVSLATADCVEAERAAALRAAQAAAVTVSDYLRARLLLEASNGPFQVPGLWDNDCGDEHRASMPSLPQGEQRLNRWITDAVIKPITEAYEDYRSCATQEADVNEQWPRHLDSVLKVVRDKIFEAYWVGRSSL
jgi:hypothetical protein